ncbi:MAG: glycerol-3-phosphate responsive antiterminator [Clostridiales bacterium]|jgi:glycerol uptake operon antiterminator|nr:glycerol-3-phosphate responsive antiterminator [Clostridiales bacterium]
MLTTEEFLENTEVCPVIAAVNKWEAVEKCQEVDCKMVNVLFGDICNIADIVKQLKKIGKVVFVHVDLIMGFASKEICVDFIKKYTEADGIISTKPYLIKHANEMGLFTIQRFFLIDFITYANVVKHVHATDPNVVELLPAGLSKVIRYLCDEIDRPVIAGGLVLDKDDVIGALSAGAIAVSTTNQEIWCD